jgi:outer membrane lipoprotein
MILLILVMLSCASGMSKQARSKVNYFGSFSQLQRQPDRYLQKTVMWGGRIIQISSLKDATELVVLQLDLSSQERPQDNDRSQGRFVAHRAGFLDPAIYPNGTLITVIGRLTGVEERQIGEMAYQYPVIETIEIKKWPPSGRQSPQFHIGIGVGTHF